MSNCLIGLDRTLSKKSQVSTTWFLNNKPDCWPSSTKTFEMVIMF